MMGEEKMKNARALLWFLVGILLSFFLVPFARGATVELQLSAPPIYPGDSFQVNAMAIIGPNEKVVAFGFDVLWDENMAMLETATVDNVFTDMSQSYPYTDIGGITFPGVGGGINLTLFTLDFTALHSGMTTVGISSAGDDGNEGLFIAYGTGSMNTMRVVLSSEIDLEISQVPIPSAFILLFSGLILVVGRLGLKRC